MVKKHLMFEHELVNIIVKSGLNKFILDLDCQDEGDNFASILFRTRLGRKTYFTNEFSKQAAIDMLLSLLRHFKVNAWYNKEKDIIEVENGIIYLK